MINLPHSGPLCLQNTTLVISGKWDYGLFFFYIFPYFFCYNEHVLLTSQRKNSFFFNFKILCIYSVHMSEFIFILTVIV